jgi:hypothetical protein
MDSEAQRGGTLSPYIDSGKNYIYGSGSGKYIRRSEVYIAREVPGVRRGVGI